MTAARLRLWLDGADTSTMFQDTAGTIGATGAGQTVARWNDKSGQGGSVAQTTSGSRPALATVAGRPVPGFDGTDDWLTLATPSQLPSGTNGSTEFVVAQSSEANPASSGYRTSWQHGSAATGAKRSIYKNTGAATVLADVYAGTPAASGSWSSTSPTIAAAEFASGAFSLWTAGTSAASSSYAFNTGTTFADVGRAGSNGYHWAGPVPEVIVLNTTLTAAERRQVEEYLARKWSSPITPSAPGAVAAAAGDGQATVSWSPPWTGGSAITGYTVTASNGGTCTTTGSSCAVTGLTNGTTYTFTVAATNAAGTGPSSSSVSAIPYPAAVMSSARLALWLDGADTTTLFQDSGGTTAATSSGNPVGQWRDKSTQGDHAVQATSGARPTLSTVNGRLVPTFDGSDDYLNLTPSKLPNAGTSSTQVVVAGLSDALPTWTGARTVLGWGDGGWNTSRMIYKGAWSGALTADLGSWSGQLTDGAWQTGPTIAISEVDTWSHSLWARGRRPGASGFVCCFGTATTGATVGKNPNSGNTDYWYGPVPEVIVLNTTATAAERRQVEEYLARKWSSTITPQAPASGPTATAGDGSVSATWSAPSWDGGSAVTGYTATATSSTGGASNSCTATAPTTTCTITGLDNGATYTVTVAATNSVGTGPSSSASSSVVPYPATIMTAARMRLWLDAADTSTMFQDTGAATAATTAGQTVARWNDKSGQGGSVQQGTSGNRPALATVNGRPVPSFDGTDDWLSLGTVSQLPSGTNPSTEIVVAANTEANPASSVWRVPWAHGTNTTGAGRIIYKQQWDTKL
jgi:hypothetical protein